MNLTFNEALYLADIRITLSESQIEKRAEELVKLGFTVPPVKKEGRLTD